MFDINGKVALITGASGGIGSALSKELLRNGLKGLSLIDINQQAGDLLLAEIEEEFGGNKAIFIKSDVTKKDELENAFKETICKFNNIDIVINNAGILDEWDWEKVVDVNVKGVINGVLLAFDKYLLKHKSTSEAVILNTCSLAGIEEFCEIPIYTSTKFAVQGLTRSFGHSYYYQKTGIRVIAICPGGTESVLNRNAQKNAREDFSLFHKNEEFIVQSPKFLAEQAIDLITAAKSGSIWVIKNKKPAVNYELPPLK